MRDRGRPRRLRPAWTTYVFSYPRLSRLNFRYGRRYFLFWLWTFFRAAGFAAAERVARGATLRGAGFARRGATARGALGAAGGAARLVSAAAPRWASVKRV